MSTVPGPTFCGGGARSVLLALPDGLVSISSSFSFLPGFLLLPSLAGWCRRVLQVFSVVLAAAEEATPTGWGAARLFQVL